MSDEQKVLMLREALEKIRELTYATYDKKIHILHWAQIQAEAARALRDTD